MRLPHFFVQACAQLSYVLIVNLANLDDGAIASLPSDFDNGIYYGWASVDRTDVHKMVMSVGYNPHYGNRKKSMV